MSVLLDASAIMAVILDEPNRNKVIKLTKSASLLTPEVISFEIGNALINLFKRKKITEEKLLLGYRKYVTLPVRIIKVDIEKALKIACKYKMCAYDAYYLETACRLKIPLITFDEAMKRVAIDLKIDVLNRPGEEQDENI
ncbi:MAG: type II toxin-antitoxin system VapC family toxin [Treponema sp.]|nr:type II toxin-antitoxin system VapC family toxin [Treponema sp.]